MASIFEAVDTSSLAAVKAAIDQKDRTAFGTAYKMMLESCYSCHKSVGRPYLRPMMPDGAAADLHQLQSERDLAVTTGGGSNGLTVAKS
jgi:hypothetical protein